MTTQTLQPLSQQKLHKKVIDKGPPEDVMVGIKNSKVGYSIFKPLKY